MFIREYLRVFLPLLVMLAAYRVIAVPLIEPSAKQLVPIGPSVIHDRSTPWWSEYFKEGSWQLDQPMMAETEQGTVLLFGKLEKLAADRIKLAPLTILIPQKDESAPGSTSNSAGSKRRTIVIENPQGTEIQFRGAIDFLGGQLPPVKGGQMIGEVKIYAPPKEGDPRDGMLIETRELRIDRRHIWTTGAVKMKIGRSHIDGRDLSIYLDQDLLSSKIVSRDQPESPLNGLDHLELIYVDRVHIDLPDDGLFAERSPGRVSVHPPRPAQAEVHCDGAFHFNFHESLATLMNKVELRHLVEGLPPDTFQSDQIYLHFRWAKPSNVSSSSSESSPTNTDDWSIDRIEAIGTNSSDPNDPARWIRLEAPSMHARGQGRWLKIELDRGRLALANHLPGVVANDSSQVYLQRDSLQVWSPEIEYESQRLVSTDSQSASAKNASDEQHLGQLWAAGPGQAAVVSEDGDPWRLSWAKSLKLQPDGNTDRLTIDGSANARSDRQGRFSADIVDLWLRNLSQDVITRVAAQVQGYIPSSILPERMHAAGQVMVHTSQLRAQVTDMQIWFSYPEIEAAKQRPASIDPQATTSVAPLRLEGDASPPTRQFTTPPNVLKPQSDVASTRGSNERTSSAASPLGTAFSNLAAIANSASQGPVTSSRRPLPQAPGPGQLATSNMELPGPSLKSSPSREPIPSLPMNVTGETLVAKLSQTSRGMLIEDLALSGIVTVTRDQASPTSPWPLTITGSQVRMDSSDEGRLDATIIGSPAKFAIGSGAIESTEIRFNERRQMVWIDQPGSFRIPPEAMQSIAAKPNNAVSSVSSGNSLTAPGLIPSRGKSDQSIEWIEAPEIRWQGRMVFDSRVVRMDGGVKLNGRLQTDADTIWHLEGRANEMLVELQEPIAIGSSSNGQTKIANIQLREAVDIKSAQTDLKGTRRQLDHLEVPELTILVPKQQWIGTGPGSLRSRRIGNANPGSPIFSDKGKPSQSISPSARNPQAELQCLHLRFRGRMEGDMNQQLVSFHDRVEALLEPILSWDQAPDVQLVDRLKIGQTTLMGDQLSVYNTAKLSWNQTQIANEQLRRDAAWEVTCAGHVIVESVNDQGSLAVTASRAQYVAIHSLLRIEGAPREAAVIEHTPANQQSNTPPSRTEISTGAINLKTGEMETQISSVRVNLPGNNNPPNPAANGQQPATPGSFPNSLPGSNTSTPILPSARDSNPLRRP